MERQQRVVVKDGKELHHCSKCKSYKDPSEFYLNKASLTGRGSYCKPCMKSYSQEPTWVEWRKVRYYKNPARTIWIEAKNRAKRANLPFNIDVDDCAIPDECCVLGIKLLSKGNGHKSDATPTLDKVVNTKGYIKGNVRVISWKANRLKSDCDNPEVFEAIAGYIRGHTNDN